MNLKGLIWTKNLEEGLTPSILAVTYSVSSLLILFIHSVGQLSIGGQGILFSLFLYHLVWCLLFGQCSINVCRIS